MGTDLGDLVEPREISFEHMFNKEIGIDAMNTMYQFLSIIRQPNGTPLKDSSGNVTSHLSGLFYRNVKLIENGIQPIYIFDGSPPDLKAKEAKERRKKREKAREEWKRLKEEGKMKKAFSKATQSSKLTRNMIEEAKGLLDALGIPVVQAPSEGEAQAAYMNRNGDIWAVGGQDWDSLLFQADTLVRNLTITGRRKIPGKDAYKEIVPEQIDRNEVLESLGISQEKLIWAAILIGTDFNPGGVTGIGPKTAMKLVAEYADYDELLDDDKVDWEHDNDPHEILHFFKEPPTVDDYSTDPDDPDPDMIRQFLVDKHDFSDDRVGSTIDKLMDAVEDGQDDLSGYF
jgi:flap endonuclease-1